MPLARTSPHSNRTNGTAISTNVSEASRRDARPVKSDVQSIIEEFDELTNCLLEIDMRLSEYNSARMLKEQTEIRRQGGNTLKRWIARKVKLDEERRALVSRKQEIQNRRTAIKPMAQSARHLLSNSNRDSPVMVEILAVLKEIRDRLPEKHKSAS
jgi:hypothetical protein